MRNSKMSSFMVGGFPAGVLRDGQCTESSLAAPKEAATMVLDLLESGHTQCEIAMVCDVHQTTISKLARGDTRDMLGRSYAALTALHKSSFNSNNKVNRG